MCAVNRTIETGALSPSMDDARVLARRKVPFPPETAGEQISALPASNSASHSPMPLRVCSVTSNCTGRPVFFWITIARSRTLPPPTTSSIVNRTRSQPLSSLSMARLNIAKSRRCPSSGRRTRMVQTSFGFSGCCWPISRPLFQGARRQGEMGFPVVIVVSDAGPVHLSAGSPSTGCDNLPRKDAIALKAAVFTT